MKAEIQASRGAKLELIINNADNQVVAYLNAEQVYTKSTEHDPSFNDSYDFGSRLQVGRNILDVVGVNWGGPHHFKGTVKLNGNVVGPWDDYRKGSSPGLVSDFCFVITVS